MKDPKRICVAVPSAYVEHVQAIAQDRETNFSAEVRRAIRHLIEAERLDPR